MDLIIPDSKRILFETELEPDSVAQKISTKAASSQGDVQLFLNKHNKVAVGLPYCIDISSSVESAQDIPQEIKNTLRTHNFHLVSLSCSFLPDFECNFKWARFAVELTTPQPFEKPIAWDIFPAEVVSEVNQAVTIEINPQLSFSWDKIKASAGLFSVKRQGDRLTYEPEIFATGFRTSDVAWDFRSTAKKAIWGDKRDLLIIVMSPKGSTLKGRFKISAQVETEKPLFKLLFSGRKDNILNKLYDLSV